MCTISYYTPTPPKKYVTSVIPRQSYSFCFHSPNCLLWKALLISHLPFSDCLSLCPSCKVLGIWNFFPDTGAENFVSSQMTSEVFRQIRGQIWAKYSTQLLSYFCQAESPISFSQERDITHIGKWGRMKTFRKPVAAVSLHDWHLWLSATNILTQTFCSRPVSLLSAPSVVPVCLCHTSLISWDPTPSLLLSILWNLFSISILYRNFRRFL